MLYNTAVHQIGAGQTVIFNNLVLLFSQLAAAVFLVESITLVLVHIIGFILIVVGVVLGTGGHSDIRTTQQYLHDLQEEKGKSASEYISSIDI